MHNTKPTILLCVVVLLTACRPQCDVIEVPRGHLDTLRSNRGSGSEMCTIILPADGDWFIQSQVLDYVFSSNDRRGLIGVQVTFNCRGDMKFGPYEHNMHDYRGESRSYQELDGTVITRRFARHICSPLGGWYGVFEYDARAEGDSVFLKSFVAVQELPEKLMTVAVNGRFRSKEEQEKFRQEAFQAIASIQWLSANELSWCK